MLKHEYLTEASLHSGSVADDFADLIDSPDDERIVAALKSAYTKALFNGVVAVKHASEPRLMLDLLISVNRNLNNIEPWRVIEEGRIDLETTLEMTQMELVTSAAHCGGEALPLLQSALATDNDVLHFGVLAGVRESGEAVFGHLVRSYVSDFDNRALPADSRSHLMDTANEVISACLDAVQPG